MFWTRLISGIILVAAVALTLYGGGIVLWLPLMLVALLGMKELHRALKGGTCAKPEGTKEPAAESSDGNAPGEKEPGEKAAGRKLWSYLPLDPPLDPLEMAGYAGAAACFIAALAGIDRYGMMAVSGTLIAVLFVYVFCYPKYEAAQAAEEFFAVAYVALMLSYLYSTRSLPDGRKLSVLVFLCSWGCDTCAYCVGMLFGKHKMTPLLSPKKSVEGAVGGVAGAALLGGLYALAVGAGVFGYGLICACGALVSMVGDLAASAIKRNRGIKDYGDVIPGHGGILDRFDSVIITAPIIFYLAKFLLS